MNALCFLPPQDLSMPALYPWNALSTNIPSILAHPSDLCLLREVFLNFLDSIGFCPFPSLWSYIAITCNCVFVWLTTSSMGSGTRPGIRHHCIPRVGHSAWHSICWRDICWLRDSSPQREPEHSLLRPVLLLLLQNKITRVLFPLDQIICAMKQDFGCTLDRCDTMLLSGFTRIFDCHNLGLDDSLWGYQTHSEVLNVENHWSVFSAHGHL